MINVVCKLFMMLVRDCINGLVEESGILGDIQDVFIRGRMYGLCFRVHMNLVCC